MRPIAIRCAVSTAAIRKPGTTPSGAERRVTNTWRTASGVAPATYHWPGGSSTSVATTVRPSAGCV
jgi:hypothetical protein